MSFREIQATTVWEIVPGRFPRAPTCLYRGPGRAFPSRAHREAAAGRQAFLACRWLGGESTYWHQCKHTKEPHVMKVIDEKLMDLSKRTKVNIRSASQPNFELSDSEVLDEIRCLKKALDSLDEFAVKENRQQNADEFLLYRAGLQAIEYLESDLDHRKQHGRPKGAPVVPGAGPVASGDGVIDSTKMIRGIPGTTKNLLFALYPGIERSQPKAYAEMRAVEYFGRMAKGALGDQEFRAMSHGTGTGGGYMIPVVLFNQVLSDAVNTSSILSAMTFFPLEEGDSLELPIWKTGNRAGGTLVEGINVRWTGESLTIPESEGTMNLVRVTAHKCAILCHASNEFLSDSSIAESSLRDAIAKSMQFALEVVVTSGNGVAKPLGSFVSPHRIVVDRTTANSIEYADLVNMAARIAPGRAPRWNFSAPAWAKVCLMESTSGDLIVDPSATGARTLLGFPVEVNDLPSNVGSEADAVLFDPSAIGCVVKATAGVNAAVVKSDQFRFDRDESSFRMVVRLGTSPLSVGQITPRNSGPVQSWCVVLGV